jgi:hypothetical protein
LPISAGEIVIFRPVGERVQHDVCAALRKFLGHAKSDAGI